MLQSISWTQYCLITGSLTFLYYLWWLKKYGVPLSRRTKKRPSANRLTELYSQPTIETAGLTVPATEFPTSGVPAPETPTLTLYTPIDNPATHPFLPQLAAELLKSVTNLAESAATNQLPASEIFASLKNLLTTPPHHRLRNTPFQQKLSESIAQIFRNLGSEQIDASVVSGLWDG